MSNEVAQKPNTPAAFAKFLETYKAQMALTLPKHVSADRMARLAVSAYSRDYKLQECSPQSIILSLMNASALGLEPGVNGQGYLIPYKGTCTFVPGWKGLVDLANRSRRCSVWTGAVFVGDEFDYELGTRPFVKHRPGDDLGDWTKLTHVYAVGWVMDAVFPVIEVWPIRKVWAHRDEYNKVGNRHYSYDNPEMYARKVPLLQVLKYMPQSIELNAAMEAADAAESGAYTVDGQGLVSTLTDGEVNGAVPPSDMPSASEKPARAEVRMPQAKTAEEPKETHADEAKEFTNRATASEKRFLENKAKDKGRTLDDMAKEAGISDLANLTADGFIHLKEFIAGYHHAA